MKMLLRFALLSFLLSFLACEDPGATDSGDTTGNDIVNTDTSANNASDDTPSGYNENSIPDQKNCEINEKHFDKNVFNIKELAKTVAIIANESTKDSELGDSHRVLEVLNTTDCSSIQRETLPVNRSPDFPYYLVPATYESKNQVLAIQGYDRFYLYDLKKDELIGPIEPKFLGEVEAVDAQSGMVKGLTCWGKYIMGHAVDFGNFAFDISDTSSPKAITPVAEFQIPNTGEKNRLFVLEAGNDRFQAILPTTDIDAGGNMFALDKMFRQPLKINTTVAKNVRNNRFIIFNDSTDPAQEKKVAIDMFGKKQIQLPDNIATKSTSEVLSWLRNQ